MPFEQAADSRSSLKIVWSSFSSDALIKDAWEVLWFLEGARMGRRELKMFCYRDLAFCMHRTMCVHLKN